MWNGRVEDEKKWCFVEEAPSNLASRIHTNENVYEKHPNRIGFYRQSKSQNSQLSPCHICPFPLSLPFCAKTKRAKTPKMQIACFAHSNSSYSSRSCMKLLTANNACLSTSWSTSMPSADMPSLPTLTRPSTLDLPGRQPFAILQRLFVELMDGHDDEISFLSRRTVRALSTFMKMLHGNGQRELGKQSWGWAWHTLV